MNNVKQLIKANGFKAGKAMIAKCGCAVEANEVELCSVHESMTEAEIVTAISIDLGLIEAPSVQEETTTTKEEVTMTKPAKVSFKDLKAQAVAMGVDIKGLRSIKAVQEAMEAHQQVAATTVEEPKAEPVAIELDYTAAITEYATDLLTLVSTGTDYTTLAKRVSNNAFGILGAQIKSGVELTKEQKAIMARHCVKAIGLDEALLMTSVQELNAMSGTQLYIFAVKLGAQPKLADIEALRSLLIDQHKQAVAKRQYAKQQASEASRANAVSTQYKPFTSAYATRVYPNAVQFVADGTEYTFIINKNGKGVLRQGSNSQYMQAKFLKGLLYNINTKNSRYLVKVLGNLKPTKPNTQVGGAATAAKEKNSTAQKEQDTLTIKFGNESYSIPKSWYNQFVTTCNTNGHKGSITASMIVEAWAARS